MELVPADRDYHRFIWRHDPQEPLVDYRMCRLIFGVSASSFTAAHVCGPERCGFF